ncbi:MAG: LCP family protein [Propionibacteriaceae bacterium]|jgi:LCP family protein required for cell wall assembly|nr:LCP family protein [Propionibacteriaceae bacterium]
MSESATIEERSRGAKARRAWTLLGLGFVAPGSAQAVHGEGANRSLGRGALKIWIGLLILVVVALVVFLLFRNAMIGFLATPLVLKVLAVAVFALGTLWTILALDTIVIARPRSLGAGRGMVFTLVALVLTVCLSLGTFWAGQAMWVTGGSLGNIFTGGGDKNEKEGRYNILLLGADTGEDRWGTRPDSINVISVSAKTGRAVIFALPRNLENVPFVDGSPLQALYPTGYYCDSHECLLNAVYLLGQEHADLYPNAANPGIQATLDAVEAVTGLDINYYAMIDMDGFQNLIDAMGGLIITVNERLPIDMAEDRWVEVGTQHMDGFVALWYARSRESTSDYDRMQRQRCIMTAMLHQLNPSTVATKFTQLASASGETVTTSVPPSAIGEMASLALKARALPITSVAFTPPLVETGWPDFASIQAVVATTIAGSEALDAASSAPSVGTSHGGTDPDSVDPPPAPPEDVPNETQDLEAVCSA